VSPDIGAAGAQGALNKLTQLHGSSNGVQDKLQPPNGGNSTPSKDFGFALNHIKAASEAALAAAVSKANALALGEELDIEAQLYNLIQLLLKKLEIKMRHFEQLDNMLKQEQEKVASVQGAVTEEQKQGEAVSSASPVTQNPQPPLSQSPTQAPTTTTQPPSQLH